METADGGYPLSFAQEQLWFLDELRGGSSSEYLLHEAFRLRGPLDRAALDAALTRIAERHEVLRTRYGTADGAGVQYVDEPAPVAPTVVDLTALAGAEQEQRLRELGAAEAAAPIDLRTRAPWRLVLVRLAPQEAVLLVTVHHIAFDNWSWSVLTGELQALYGAFSTGAADPLPEPEVQYADFAEWERETWAARPELMERQRAYWQDRLAGLTALELPTDHRRPPVWEPAGAAVRFTVPAELAERLAALGRSVGATPFMVHLAAFQLLLGRYADRTDIAVGVSVARRDQPGLEQLIGMFLNTVVLRTDLAGGPGFTDLLARVRETVLAAHEHLDVPFDQVVKDLAPERDPSRNPLFQVGFGLHRAQREPFALPGLEVELCEGAAPAAAFDLGLYLGEEADGSLSAALRYPTALFEPARIERMAAHLLRLLAAVANRPTRPVAQLELLTPAELAALADWNRTGTPAAGPSLPELFLARARATPGAVAVVADGEQLDYAELARRVADLVGVLRRRGVGRGTPVGVALHRGPELVVALLAVLAAGGVYVPLPPEHPADRLAHQVADAGVALVLTEQELLDRLPAGPVLLTVEEARREAVGSPATALTVTALDAADAAYVMYTSGSTGRPKGVVITHGGLRNRVLWSVDQYGLGPGARVLQKTVIGFDASMWEFLSPLVSGAAVVCAPREAHRDPAVMLQAVVDHRVTVLQLVPSVLRLLLDEPALAGCTSLRAVCAAGEPLPAALCARLRAVLDVVVVNTYGPTECTIDATAWRYREAEQVETVPIGRPLPGVRSYVVDAQEQLVPVGVPGELRVGGACLARGYLGRGGLTADRFGPDPYAERPGERWYRTGDLVRRRADGVLEFLGRVDDQIKLRGVRVEPGEIEAALVAHPAVAAAVVTTHRPAGGELALVGFPVRAQGAALDVEELRAHLAARLPEAMVPSLLIPLDELPLTPNGKVDRRRLPDPEQRDAPVAEAAAAPRTATERQVAELMAEVLGLERVGVEQDFFQLGGHSLLAIRLMLRLRRAFEIKLTVGDLFTTRTVAALAARVDTAVADRDGAALRPVPRTGDLPLSYGQQRMWFLDQLEPGSDEYLIPLAMRLRGPLDHGALRGALTATVAKHEVLRTRYLPGDGDPRQRVDPAGPVELTVHDLSGRPGAAERARALVDHAGGVPFDLARECPLRATLVKVAADEHLLVLTLHHIAFDAWSMELYLRDLDQAYRALVAGEPVPLAAPEIQYADFAHWQRGCRSADETSEQLDYWRERLADLTPIELPADRPRSAVRDTRGATLDVPVPAELAAQLRALADRQGVTLFMALLTAFQVLLGRYTSGTDVVVGTPVAGRTRPETEELVGLFTNTLVLRTDLAGNPAVGELLDRVRQDCLAAFARQDVPFEQLVDALLPNRDLSRNPLFQVMFELQHLADLPTSLGAAALELVEAGPAVAKFDLTLTVAQHADGRLECCFEYATALFDRATVERLAGHYLTLLAGCAADAGARIADLAMLTEPERRELLAAVPDAAAELLDPAAEHGLTVPQLFDRQAARTPGAVAVVCGDEQLTYAELSRRVDEFARRLTDLGVAPETVVASCLERSTAAVVVLLAVLRAGGVYVPFDPRHPAERLGFMLDDAAAELVVTAGEFADRFAGRRVLLADIPAERPAESPAELPAAAPAALPDHLAYVIYTSGSTGRPKGVMISHRSYAHHCRVIADAYGIAPGERVVLLSALTFDVAMDQIAATLTAGATVVVGDPVFWTPAELPARLAEHRVTIMEITPSYYRAMLESPAAAELGSLKLVNVGSDVVTAADARRWAALGLPGRFLCNYGPTEATVTCLLHPVDDARLADRAPAATMPLGRPVPGTRAHVLDADLRPVPAGVPGQLCLGGTRLARGYHRRPGLTAERFVPDPFGAEPGGRLYLTGDLVRRRADGVLEFLGRLDQQVKLRGLRIELGEIEAALLRHPDVQEAAVLAHRTAPGESLLAGYLVARPHHPAPQTAQLRTHLRELLPDYMVPAQFAVLDALPLTPSGKVDRKALPALARPVEQREYLAPRDPAEEAVAGFWCEVLGVDRVGVLDDFFALGGHSLLATRVLARIRAAFGIELPLRLLFEATTVADLADAVSTAVEAEVAELTDDEVEALLAQKGVR
ncbi:amino acid adenylation domain-containing protein [Kitasatospora sp. NPDC058965]|uniref:amino acid adenylation domain-containing protein n=1 Tax=Kitasatospora sp. NPDC058965 TaxID=3346682 RepID=UPI0036A253AB